MTNNIYNLCSSFKGNVGRTGVIQNSLALSLSPTNKTSLYVKFQLDLLDFLNIKFYFKLCYDNVITKKKKKKEEFGEPTFQKR